ADGHVVCEFILGTQEWIRQQPGFDLQERGDRRAGSLETGTRPLEDEHSVSIDVRGRTSAVPIVDDTVSICVKRRRTFEEAKWSVGSHGAEGASKRFQVSSNAAAVEGCGIPKIPIC